MKHRLLRHALLAPGLALMLATPAVADDEEPAADPMADVSIEVIDVRDGIYMLTPKILKTKCFTQDQRRDCHRLRATGGLCAEHALAFRSYGR